MGSAAVPSASSWPSIRKVAPVFMSMRVPGSIVTTAPSAMTTVPVRRFVPVRVRLVLMVPVARFVTAEAVEAAARRVIKATQRMERRKIIKNPGRIAVGVSSVTISKAMREWQGLVLGSWFLVLGSWFLVLGSWFLVLGSLFVVRGNPRRE